MLLLERYGTLPLRAVMEYAIGYAANGYPMLPAASAAIEAVAGTFLEHWPGSAEVYLAGGVPAPGSRFANPAARDGLPSASWPRPSRPAPAANARSRPPGKRSTRASSPRRSPPTWLSAEVMDVTGHRNRGLLAGADLAGWRASAEQPVTAEFHGLTVCKTGPWGQGPVFLQQLALLDGLGIDELQPGSAALHPHRDRVGQARLRRPRGVVRRSAGQRRCRSPRCCRPSTRCPAVHWSASRHRPRSGPAPRTA